MPNVTINSHNIGSVLTADVINMRDVESFSADERQKIVEELVAAIRAQTSAAPLSSELRQELDERAAELAKPAPPKDRQKQLQAFFKTVRSCFGDATAIVTAAVKIGQLFSA